MAQGKAPLQIMPPLSVAPEIAIPSAGAGFAAPLSRVCLSDRSFCLRVYRGGCSFGPDASANVSRSNDFSASGNWAGVASVFPQLHKTPAKRAEYDMTDGFFFGYGSLVNRQTHVYADTSPATIRGWRREWRKSFAYGQTFLSVVPDASAQIDGLVARVPGGDWGALDIREAGYERLPLAPEQIIAPRAACAQIYAVAREGSALPGPDAPVTLSYLDVVIEGFWTEFGPAGVARFFESTTGWAAVLDDRMAPRYPRARPVARALCDVTDSYLDALNVRRLTT